ncbi:13081_t:CDS:2 [Entrophospora sp. SA101]|nr:13081_t:CDS:2 [Entrophospora sp. SA101]
MANILYNDMYGDLDKVVMGNGLKKLQAQNVCETVKIISKYLDTNNFTGYELILSGVIEKNEIEEKTICQIPQYYKQYLVNFFEHREKKIPKDDTYDSKLLSTVKKYLCIIENIWDLKKIPKKKKSITEPTYSHEFVTHLVDFLKDDLPNIETSWFNVESTATKNRNNLIGPRRCPDVLWSLESGIEELNFEILYIEISNGPFNITDKHIKKDKIRLGKYCKDSLNYIHNESYSVSPDKKTKIISIIDGAILFSLHFHGLLLDVYAVERSYPPLFRMRKIMEIGLPLIKDEIDVEKFVDFFEQLDSLKDLIKKNIKKFSILGDLISLDQASRAVDNNDSDVNNDNNDNIYNDVDERRITFNMKTYNTPQRLTKNKLSKY